MLAKAREQHSEGTAALTAVLHTSAYRSQALLRAWKSCSPCHKEQDSSLARTGRDRARRQQALSLAWVLLTAAHLC